MSNFYVSSVKWAAITQWAASTAYTLGQYRRQLAAVVAANGRVFKVTTAGTSGGTEPAWSLIDGGTTNDGTVVWTQVGGREAEQVSGNWQAALPTLEAATNAAPLTTPFIFVADNHVQSVAAALTVSGLANTSRICVVAGSTVPPVHSELRTTALIETTGNNALTINVNSYYYGFVFKSGTGPTGGPSMLFSGSGVFENCEFHIPSTNVNTFITIGGSSTARGTVEWINCSVTLSSTAQRIQTVFSEHIWRDTATPLLGSIPAVLVSNPATNGTRPASYFKNLDLTAVTGTLVSIGSAGFAVFENCKLNAAVARGAGPRGYKNTVQLHNCTDSNSINYNFEEVGETLNVFSDTTIIADGGATDGVTPISFRFLGKSANEFQAANPTCPRISKRINTTGVSKTFTIEAVWVPPLVSTPMPIKRDFYTDFHLALSATTPSLTRSSTRTSVLDTAVVTSSNLDWTGNAPVRVNSAVVGNTLIYYEPTAPNMIWKVTTGGTFAASPPAAYATAVDGDTFTDGTAIVRACVRFKMAVTATPARQSMMDAELVIHQTSPGLVYVDPKIRVT